MLQQFARAIVLSLAGLTLISAQALCMEGRSDGSHEISAEELIEEAQLNNRNLAALRKEIKALEEEAPAAGAFVDPKISIGLLNIPTDTFDFDQEPMTQKQVALTQRLKWFGKLSLAQKKAVLKAERQKAELHLRELELARDIAVAFHELGATYERMETNNALYEVLGAMLKVTESRYATGSGQQQDILQAQVEMNLILDERIVLERQLRQQKDRINELVQRPGIEDIAPHAPPELVMPSLERKQLIEGALQDNAGIQVRHADIKIAEVAVEIARKEFMPDVDLSLAYGQREADQMGIDRADFFSAGISFTLPLWAPVKQQKTLEGARSRLEATHHALESLRTTLPHKIDTVLAEIEALQDNHKLLQDVLTLQASQWAESSLAAFEVGAVDFDTALTAELRLVRFGLKLRTYKHQLRSALARLEELVGAPVATKSVNAHTNQQEKRHLEYSLAVSMPKEKQ